VALERAHGQKLESREFSVAGATRVPPFPNEAGTRLNVFFPCLLLARRCRFSSNATHSNYFQSYNDAILAIGEVFLKFPNCFPTLHRQTATCYSKNRHGMAHASSSMFSIQLYMLTTLDTETKITMDPALSSQAVTMATEFGPPTYTQNESQQNRVDFREVRYSLPLYRKSVEGSSSPSRKKSRFFNTLLLRTPQNENIADENGSPKPLRKRKSIADFLPFFSTRSRKVPDGNDVDPGSRNKRSETTSPLKRNALRTFKVPDTNNSILI
jgi:hypothetical protein